LLENEWLLAIGISTNFDGMGFKKSAFIHF